MRTIRIGIIGTGVIAHQHMAHYSKIPGVEVVAACDLIEGKLADFCGRYSIPNSYQDFRELLKRDDIEAVDVCLHNNLHAPIAVAVMAAGKHCYLEKPMAGSYTDALAIKNAAKHFGVKLHIQLAMIYGGPVIAAKKLIDAGRLGKIYHARSYGYRRRGRPYVDGYAEKEFCDPHYAGHGALYDMGVYHISQMLYLLGLPKLLRVSGNVYQELAMPNERRAESSFGVEELGTGYAKYEGGLSMDIIESWAIHSGPFPTSQLYGSTGGIRIEDKSIRYYSEIEGYPAETTLDVGTEDFYQFRHNQKRPLYENSQAHWIGVLRGEVEAIDTAEIALQTMLVSEGIFLSHTLGREIAADEIESLSQSSAIFEQETPFGTLTYPKHPFI